MDGTRLCFRPLSINSCDFAVQQNYVGKLHRLLNATGELSHLTSDLTPINVPPLELEFHAF